MGGGMRPVAKRVRRGAALNCRESPRSNIDSYKRDLQFDETTALHPKPILTHRDQLNADLLAFLQS
jgi:hypothetical protein